VNTVLRLVGLSLLLAVTSVWADTGLNELSIARPAFVVKAGIAAGCLMGSGAADVTTFGNISFGQVTTLPSNVNVVSAVGAGSIQLQCTPGTAVSIAIGTGVNSSNISTGRFLAKGAETLRYQLYQDSGSTIWGNGTNGTTAKSVTFPVGSPQTYPIYARLFAVTPMPSAGIYSDTVVVTITY
jgi:spore coat protein U-like protein